MLMLYLIVFICVLAASRTRRVYDPPEPFDLAAWNKKYEEDKARKRAWYDRIDQAYKEAAERRMASSMRAIEAVREDHERFVAEVYAQDRLKFNP